jgi:hypothetical protein
MERGKTQMKFNPKDNQKEKGKETALTASVEVKITQQEQKGSCSRHKHWNQHDGGDVLDNLHHRIQSQYRPQERHLEYHLFMGYHVSSFCRHSNLLQEKPSHRETIPHCRTQNEPERRIGLN